MGTYRVPRNTKGESRILIIFSTKALIYTVVGLVVGYFINYLLSIFEIHTVGIVIMAVLGVLGFTLGTLKIPEMGAIPITKDVAGEKIDEIIVRYYKFKKNGRKIYINEKIEKAETKDKKGEKKNDK